MRLPTNPPSDDRPTTPLPSLALAEPAPDRPPRASPASPPPYWPVAGGPTVYRPESSYSVIARPAQPLLPSHRRGSTPPHRWPWVIGGVIVLVLTIGLTFSPTKSTPPAMTIGDPASPAPAPTQSNTNPIDSAIPAPPGVIPVPAIAAPALARATPRPVMARAVVPSPRLVVPAPATTLRPTPVPVPTSAAEPSGPATTIHDAANTAETPPSPVPTQPVSTPSPSAESTYYVNCAAARAAGAAPLHRRDPGYRAGLDREGDGIACE